MRKQMVVGNWKLNGSRSLCEEFALGLAEHRAAVELAVCPPAVYIDFLVQELAINGASVAVGGQNVAEHDSGAYTGEISATMLQELGAKYAIVGHSERRAMFGETGAMVAAKTRRLLEAGVTPIVCFGEPDDVRQRGDQNRFIQQQLADVFGLIEPAASAPLVLAYEPIWAVGTRNTASPSQVEDMHAHIRSAVAQYGIDGAATPILYGGSVTPDNAAGLLALPDVDGALVGGASLKLDKFLAIAG